MLYQENCNDFCKFIKDQRKEGNKRFLYSAGSSFQLVNVAKTIFVKTNLQVIEKDSDLRVGKYWAKAFI